MRISLFINLCIKSHTVVFNAQPNAKRPAISAPPSDIQSPLPAGRADPSLLMGYMLERPSHFLATKQRVNEQCAALLARPLTGLAP